MGCHTQRSSSLKQTTLACQARSQGPRNCAEANASAIRHGCAMYLYTLHTIPSLSVPGSTTSRWIVDGLAMDGVAIMTLLLSIARRQGTYPGPWCCTIPTLRVRRPPVLIFHRLRLYLPKPSRPLCVSSVHLELLGCSFQKLNPFQERTKRCLFEFLLARESVGSGVHSILYPSIRIPLNCACISASTIHSARHRFVWRLSTHIQQAARLVSSHIFP